MTDHNSRGTQSEPPEKGVERSDPFFTCSQSKQVKTSTTTEPVLTPGQWEALLYQSSRDTLPLIVKLAVHHGHMEQPRSRDECPCCGERKAGQLELDISET